MPVNERFGIFSPTGRAINPVTGTNREGVGAVTEIAVVADEAFDKAVAMAQEAAEAYRNEKEAAIDALWTALTDGQMKLAIEFYRKSLKLDPGNGNAKQTIERMQENL